MLSQRGLEAFQAVVELGSLTRAARALGVSQPAVSRLLRELEARTGLTLFVRRANRLVPTEAGLTLVAEVERSFVGLAAIEAAARRLAQGRRRRLVVAAMPALATTLLPDLVAGLPADLEVEIEAARVLHAVEPVHCGRAALGFVTPLGESAAVETLSRHGFPSSRIAGPRDRPPRARCRGGMTLAAATWWVTPPTRRRGGRWSAYSRRWTIRPASGSAPGRRR